VKLWFEHPCTDEHKFGHACWVDLDRQSWKPSSFSFFGLGARACTVAGKTSEALTKLMSLAPSAAVLLDVDEGKSDEPFNLVVRGERDIDVKLLRIGDIVKIHRGAKVPADGVVLTGQSSIDEGMLTGESMPVQKRPGDKVMSGTVNHDGVLCVRVTTPPGQSMLASIVRLMERAQTNKAPIQAYADYVASFFVWAVVAFSVLTWVVWMILVYGTDTVPTSWFGMANDPFQFCALFGLAVMVIACPCGLGLGTHVVFNYLPVSALGCCVSPMLLHF
jgi:Cu+-exporting ATPase